MIIIIIAKMAASLVVANKMNDPEPERFLQSNSRRWTVSPGRRRDVSGQRASDNAKAT